MRDSALANFIQDLYAPFLLKRLVKLLVMVIFIGLFIASWIAARHIDLGLGEFGLFSASS